MVPRPAGNGPLKRRGGAKEQLLGGELAGVAGGAEDDEIVLSVSGRGHCGGYACGRGCGGRVRGEGAGGRRREKGGWRRYEANEN